jgi:hypothetical protein
MSFKAMSVEEAMNSNEIPAKVDITTALHACDTATDDAIRFALERQSKYSPSTMLSGRGSSSFTPAQEYRSP